MILTPDEGRKLHVLTLLEGKRISVGQAAEALGVTPRQVRRLRVALRREGPAGLVHGNRGRRSARRLPDALRRQIVALARGRYAGLNDHHLTEKLITVEGLAVSRATVQRVLRAAGLTSPRRRRPPRHRARRPRKLQAGLLLQLDGSPFAWFGPTQPPCSLLAAIDDATGTVLAGTFRAQEDAAGYLRLLHTLGRTVGLPAAVYTDAHGIFVRHDPHWTLAEELQGHQDPTQVGRALQTLGIHHIVAQSPRPRAGSSGSGTRSRTASPSSSPSRGSRRLRRAMPSSPPRSSRPSTPGSPSRRRSRPVRTGRSPAAAISSGSAPFTTCAKWRSITPCGWTASFSSSPRGRTGGATRGPRRTSSSTSTARGESISVIA
jgi:hypothetical protein